MKITPKLEARQSQQLVMTPQLQQAIKLLQLTNLELTEFVESQLEENPFLEREETEPGEEGNVSLDSGRDELTPADVDKSMTQNDTLDGASPGDAGAGDWSSVSGRQGPASEEYDAAQNKAETISLHDHLTSQLHLATRDEVMLMIGAHLIDMIDDGGYMREDVGEIALRLGADEALVARTLRLVQSFEPSGVGARNLQECLKLQLRDLGELDVCMDQFLEHLHLLGTYNLPALRRACKLSEEELSAKISRIRSLDPKPGLKFGHDAVQVVLPDVYVTEAEDGGWKVELNSETLPRVIANERYFSRLSSKEHGGEARNFLNEQMSNANWLVRSLDQRARTILRVATEIVKYQDEFLIKGISYLRPLNLKTIADAIEMHESTVSRVTSNKYLHTPRGMFELKYFFTPGIASRDGDHQYSAETVRHRIKGLIENEDPADPVSDEALVILLGKENIDIARRTVAKYREALGLPSSVQRRRIAKRQAV
ncbi:RNA polymerase factor sigma-54 [Parvularcula marina]|uniref:RNA polymerase factor sigma-54 n=1 Tax=Parvularcula marina TaxID=2292771 RepID=UPI0035174663